MKIDPDKDREYLLQHYGFNFPKTAKYRRASNRIYFGTDFDDGEEITFAWMCNQPNANARGNAFYYSPKHGYRLINISELGTI